MSVFSIDWTKYRLIDLSFEVVPGASQDRYFEIERGYLADNAYMHHVRTHSHVGTHVEVDAHFFDGGRDVTGYALTDFMGRGLLVDVPDVSAMPHVTDRYLEEQIGARIGEGDIVILRNSDAESLAGRRPRPTLTPEAGRWFADHRVKMVGIDTHFGLGKDVPSGRAFHDAFMGAGGTVIEFLDHLEEIRRPEFYFMALPYLVRDMDSSWARAVAIEER
jgi:arylformamidase